MRSHHSFFLLLLAVVNGPAEAHKNQIRETKVYKDASGQTIRLETTSTKSQCYQYTWLGPENQKTNGTTSCQDITLTVDNERPCFSPLVWTFNDEYGSNRPEPKDIEDACAAKNPPCVPYCIPTTGQTCVKYTLMTSGQKAVVRETHFCGRVFVDSSPVDWDTCKSQYAVDGYDVSVCSCSKTSLCNSAPLPHLTTFSLAFSIILVLLAL